MNKVKSLTKPKQIWMTDSALVLWRKDEKNLWKEYEKTLKLCTYKHMKLFKKNSDIIPFASWVSEYIYIASLSC